MVLTRFLVRKMIDDAKDDSRVRVEGKDSRKENSSEIENHHENDHASTLDDDHNQNHRLVGLGAWGLCVCVCVCDIVACVITKKKKMKGNSLA